MLGLIVVAKRGKARHAAAGAVDLTPLSARRHVHIVIAQVQVDVLADVRRVAGRRRGKVGGEFGCSQGPIAGAAYGAPAWQSRADGMARLLQGGPGGGGCSSA